MAGKLQQEIKQKKPIRLLEEESTLNLVRTADLLVQRAAEVLKRLQQLPAPPVPPTPTRHKPRTH